MATVKEKKPVATVKIELTVEADDVPYFMGAWNDIMNEMTNHASIEVATIEVPSTVIELEKY